MTGLLLCFLWHEESLSSSRIAIRGREIQVTVTLKLEDLATIVDIDPSGRGYLDRATFLTLLDPIHDYLRPRLRLWNDGEPCESRISGGVFPELRTIPLSASETPLGIVLSFKAAGAPGRPRMRCELLHDQVRSHRHLAQFADGRTAVFDRNRLEQEWEGAPSTIPQFIRLGVEHIVLGWDHVAFLVALLVFATSLGQVVKLVTAFTAAHSITLGLTALQVVAPPSGLVEAIIALSILYVAIENLWIRGGRWRWPLVFAFGLVHGMGFGGLLVEMELDRPVAALVGFNLGVELGQLALVALAFPLLSLLRRRRETFERLLAPSISTAAACCGMFWLVQRVF
jgi:hydrogenase/urease accessory protein HupE